MANKTTGKFLVAVMAAAMCFTAACSSSKNTADSGAATQTGAETARVADTESSAEAKSSAEDPAGAQSFAAAHDAFQTTLVEHNSDDDPIPDPPEGFFDLVHYSSKVGDLAAYVSSDPGDGEKHPMVIWVVGGWGNGIDDFPWTYPAWDNDQTGSAF